LCFLRPYKTFKTNHLKCLLISLVYNQSIFDSTPWLPIALCCSFIFIFALKGNHREQRCSVDGKPCNFRTVVVFCMTVIKSSAGSVTRGTMPPGGYGDGDGDGDGDRKRTVD